MNFKFLSDRMKLTIFTILIIGAGRLEILYIELMSVLSDDSFTTYFVSCLASQFCKEEAK